MTVYKYWFVGVKRFKKAQTAKSIVCDLFKGHVYLSDNRATNVNLFAIIEKRHPPNGEWHFSMSFV